MEESESVKKSESPKGPKDKTVYTIQLNQPNQLKLTQSTNLILITTFFTTS